MAYTEVKTPIVYYGGKTAMLPHLLAMEPWHEVYTETFFGGGAFFFAKKQVKNETINDRLNIVINFYRVLRTKFKPLKRLIDATLIGRSVHHEGLEIIRAHKRGEKVDPVKLAWAFWLCTNFAYSNKIGGGYKYSNHMSVAVPDTLKKRKENFTELLAQRIEHAYIECDDALKVAQSRNVPKAFHYFDPPYPMADMGHYAGKGLPGGDKYTFADLEQLLDWCATQCTGKFLLSNYNCELIDQYVQANGWHKQEIEMRVAGSKAQNHRKNRTTKKEILVSNYATPCETLKLF